MIDLAKLSDDELIAEAHTAAPLYGNDWGVLLSRMADRLAAKCPDEPSAAMFDAAAHRLAIFWPTRPPGMCGVGLLRSDEGTAVRAAAREVLIAAFRQKR